MKYELTFLYLQNKVRTILHDMRTIQGYGLGHVWFSSGKSNNQTQLPLTRQTFRRTSGSEE